MVETGSASLRYVQATTWRLSRRSEVRRWVRAISIQERCSCLSEALVAILLVEMTARPLAARALEWMIALPLRSPMGGPWRDLGRRITVGPLQLRGGARSRDTAISQARALLRHAGVDAKNMDELATFWNGPLALDRAGALCYSDALEIAHPLARRLLASERLRQGGEAASHGTPCR